MIVLRRFRRCARCGSYPNPVTAAGQTWTRHRHADWCGIGRVLAMASGPRVPSFEFLPADDRATHRSA